MAEINLNYLSNLTDQCLAADECVEPEFSPPLPAPSEVEGMGEDKGGGEDVGFIHPPLKPLPRQTTGGQVSREGNAMITSAMWRYENGIAAAVAVIPWFLMIPDGNTNFLLRRAMELLGDKEYGKSVSVLGQETAFIRAEDIVHAKRLRGAALYYLGRYDEAADLLEMAKLGYGMLKGDEDQKWSAATDVLLGDTFLELGRYEEAYYAACETAEYYRLAAEKTEDNEKESNNLLEWVAVLERITKEPRWSEFREVDKIISAYDDAINKMKEMKFPVGVMLVLIRKANALELAGRKNEVPKVLKSAIIACDESIAMSRKNGETKEEIELLIFRGSFLERLANYLQNSKKDLMKGAEESYVMAVRISAENGYKEAHARALFRRGLGLKSDGLPGRALMAVNGAIGIVESGDVPENETFRMLRGYLYIELGRFEDALDEFNQAAGVYLSKGEYILAVRMLNLKMAVLDRLGRKDELRTAFLEGFKHYNNALKEAGRNQSVIGRVLLDKYLAQLMGISIGLELSDDEIIEDLKSALAIFEKTGDRFYEAFSHKLLGKESERIGKMERAVFHYESSYKIFNELGRKEEAELALKFLARRLLIQASSLEDKGRNSEAIESAERAKGFFAELKDKDGMASSSQLLGSLFMEAGRYFKAKDAFNETALLLKELGRNKEYHLYRLTANRVEIHALLEVQNLADLAERAVAGEYEALTQLQRELGLYGADFMSALTDTNTDERIEELKKWLGDNDLLKPLQRTVRDVIEYGGRKDKREREEERWKGRR